MRNTVKHLEHEYKLKSNNLDSDFNNRKRELKEEFEEKACTLEDEYKGRYRKLEKENSKLHKIIDKFYGTIDKFIERICDKFNFGDSKELVKKFENETHTLIDPVKQMKKEEREKEFSLERY